MMENSRIARILYNMSLDMNYADFLEYAVRYMEKELQALLIISMKNENMEFWKEKLS